MLKPYSILLYILCVLLFFFLGLTYAGLIEAGKGQMLAAGAIVLGYGVLGSGIGLLISLIFASKFSRQVIVRLNVIFTLLILMFIGYYRLKYLEKRSERQEQQQEIEDLKNKKTKPVAPINNKILKSKVSGWVDGYWDELLKPNQDQPLMGMGVLMADLSSQNTLYFYNMDFSTKVDSITFGINEIGNEYISTAPPYLAPEHMKLDYGILHFKVISITKDKLEIEVNKITHQTTWVDRNYGIFQYWSDFLLNVNTIELMDYDTKLKIKPLAHAAIVNESYDYLIPIRIKGNWMKVSMTTSDYKVIGEGWVEWKRDNKLLIKYNLLS